MCDVNIATGDVTQFEIDLLLSGRIPWRLIRRYSSQNTQVGLVGCGWKLNLGTFLRCIEDKVEMTLDGEPFARLPYLDVGNYRPADDSGLAVERREAGIVVTDRSGNTYVFPCGDYSHSLIPCAAHYDHYRNQIRYRYDEDGRLRTLTDSFNRHLVFAYDVRSRLAEIDAALPDGRSTCLVRYEYDRDDLAAVVDANGSVTRYEYASHLLTRVTDPSGRDLYYQYDQDKRCVRTWLSGGVWDRQLSHDPLGQRVVVTNPTGYSVVYKHNGKGVVVSDRDALGRLHEDVLDQNDRLLLRSGARGGPTIITRVPGSRTVVMSRGGLETVFELNANDQVTSQRNYKGQVWKYEYDDAGSMTRSAAPTGAVWRFDYNKSGDLIRSTDPTGYERHRERTADRITLRDAWGLRLDERYDYLGRLIQTVDGEGGEIRFEYDDSGNQVRRVNPDGTSSRIQYDASGRPIAFVDELGNAVRMERDATDRTLRLLRPDGHEEIVEYGLMDELQRITNSKGEVAAFFYDAVGRGTAITYYDGRQHRVVYDDADNPVALMDGRTGRLLAACRYEDDQLVEESYFDGRHLLVGYGPAGEVLSVDNADASLSYERDDLMRLSVARAGELELHYAYNSRGDRTRVVTNAGRSIDYEWDGRGRLVKMGDSSSGTYEYSYDARDLVTEIHMPNGCTQQFQYDRRHRMILRRVTRVDGSEICARQYSYDAIGRLIRFVDSSRGVRTYTYDAMNALTAAEDNGEVVRFRYDTNGNLLTTRAGQGIAYEAGDRAVQVGSDELDYDDRGNLVRWRSGTGGSHFEYTGEGWLKRATLPSGLVAEYEYDGTARRTAKSVNGLRTEFDWDGVHLLSERTAEQRIDYLFMPGSFFLAGVTHNGRHYSYVADHLGTPTELIDEDGQIAWAADYAPHGEITASRVNKVQQPFRFLGQYYDEELGWHYNRFRYYHSVLGRFTSPDPLGFAAGINLYRYAPNPTNWVDPLGLAFASPAAGGNPATCEVMSRCDWGKKTMKEAQKKTDGVNEKGCDAIIGSDCERPPDQKDFLMKNCVDEDDKEKVEASLKSQNDSCKSQQVDHIKEVQCGGTNECDNLAPLVQTVNGSFGSQIKSCRNQLAAQGVKGTVRMVINLVNIRDATPEQLKNHGKSPCDSNDKRCP